MATWYHCEQTTPANWEHGIWPGLAACECSHPPVLPCPCRNWNCAPGTADYASNCAVRAEGTLSPALGSLMCARQLLAGARPDSVHCRLPLILSSFPSSCSTLTSLDMQGNKLGGSLPADWGEPGAFTKLAKLYLSQNDLTGKLKGPGWLLGCTLLHP